jgi:hypothetical protein
VCVGGGVVFECVRVCVMMCPLFSRTLDMFFWNNYGCTYLVFSI